MGELVLDAGPVTYAEMTLCGDPDLEHGLRHAGFEPDETTYRLIAIPVAAIGDTRSMANWKHMGETYVAAMREGVEFPPIVVMPVKNGWTLIDGVNRTHAAWRLGRETIVAYELLGASRTL
jgi:hypothetical protein